MPKYEDFKVGDVWICRDGREAVITRVDDITDFPSYPIRARIELTYAIIFTAEGFHLASNDPHPRDLMRPKIPPIDLTKPLRFKGAVETFSAAEIENAPEPVMVKRWATVDKVDGECFRTFDTRAGAARNCHSDQVIVELTGEYTP